MEPVADHQEPAREAEDSRCIHLLRRELIQRVNGEKLRAGLGVDRVAVRRGDFGKRFFRPCIAIAEGHPQHQLALVHQDVIHTPRIHADARDRQPPRRDFPQAGLHVFPQPHHVPAQGAVETQRAIWKAVDFFEREPSVRERAEHHAPAPGTEVHGDVMVCSHSCRNASCSHADRRSFIFERRSFLIIRV